MKKLATMLLLATTILLSPSCAEKFGVVKQISIEAESVGFTHNGEATKSAWADDISSPWQIQRQSCSLSLRVKARRWQHSAEQSLLNQVISASTLLLR